MSAQRIRADSATAHAVPGYSSVGLECDGWNAAQPLGTRWLETSDSNLCEECDADFRFSNIMSHRHQFCIGHWSEAFCQLRAASASHRQRSIARALGHPHGIAPTPVVV